MQLDLSFWLGSVLGLIGLILSYFGIQKFRYPGRITLYKERIISLFADITKNLSDLSITYKGDPINQNLYLFKGVLINTGNKDIQKKEEIYFNLDESDKWVDVKIISKSPQVYADFKIKNNSKAVLTIRKSLFRCEESIGIEALILTGHEKDIKEMENIFKIDHRISDTRDADIQEMPRKLNRKWRVFLMPIVMPIMGFILLWYYNFLSPKTNIEWKFMENGYPVSTTGKLNVNGTIELDGFKNVNGSMQEYNDVVELQSMLKKDDIKLFVKKDQQLVIMITLAVGYIILPLFFLFWTIWQHTKGRRIRNFLESN